MVHYIYRITHLPTGRFYIGKRSYKGTDYLDDTYMGSGVIIKNLLKKHPRFEFRKEVLCFCRDAEQLLKAEQAAVSVNFPANPLCINLCAGGFGTVGLVHTEEARAKIADGQRGRVHSAEAKAKIAAANKGKVHSAEARAKMSEVHRNRSVETRAKMSTSRIKDTISLVNSSGTTYEANTADAATELAAGAEFTNHLVHIHNEALGVRVIAVRRNTAKALILLNVGWHFGRRSALRQVGMAEIDKATGLLKAP